MNELNNFHVQSPGLAPCLAHDIFDGFVKRDMFLFIQYFLNKRWFKEGLLNYRLNDMKLLSENAVFIPSVKVIGTVKKKLDGTASQIRRLVLLFPAAVVHKVKDFDDPVWRMLMHLRAICSIVCAPALSYGQIALLKLEIDKYLHLRLECFSDEKLVPKHEYLRYYPMLISHFGSLKHVWTLRFESKHGEFKTDIRHYRNFKNVTQTLAGRHQLKQAAFPPCADSFVEAKKVSEYTPDAYEADVRLMVTEAFNNIRVCDVKYISHKVTFRVVEYREGMSICIGKKKCGNFLVCKIEFIIINSTYTNIAFMGKSREIILNTFVGGTKTAQTIWKAKLYYVFPIPVYYPRIHFLK